MNTEKKQEITLLYVAAYVALKRLLRINLILSDRNKQVVLESQDLPYTNINKIIEEREVAKLCCLCICA